MAEDNSGTMYQRINALEAGDELTLELTDERDGDVVKTMTVTVVDTDAAAKVTEGGDHAEWQINKHITNEEIGTVCRAAGVAGDEEYMIVSMTPADSEDDSDEGPEDATLVTDGGVKTDDSEGGDLTDAEWLNVQSDLNSYLDELREAHEVREENDEYVLFADDTGHELNEFAEANGVDRSALSARMHADARERYDGDGAGDPWSVVDPIIVYKHV